MMENKILQICLDVMTITDQEIDEIEQIYKNQMTYDNPPKPETNARQHSLGIHNRNVLEALIHLKEVIKAGEDI